MGMNERSTACAVRIAAGCNPISANNAGYPMGLAKSIAPNTWPLSNLAAGSRYVALSDSRYPVGCSTMSRGSWRCNSSN